jgi:hypothetical protein
MRLLVFICISQSSVFVFNSYYKLAVATISKCARPLI